MASAMSSRKSLFIKSVENFTRTLNVVKLLCNALLVRHDIKCTGLLAHLLCYNNKVNYVYVLKSSQDHELYIGSTNNLKRRLRDHNDKKNFSTSWRGPFELVYYEAYKNERHFIPIPLDAVAPPQKRFQFFVALVDDEPGENDYGKPKFHYYFPHMETL